MNRLLIVTTLVIFTVPTYAHAQEPNAAILKAEAQKVVSLISGDKLKTQTYCEIGDLSEQLNQAEEDKDGQKVGDLSQKIGKLEEKLGTEYTALVRNLKDAFHGQQSHEARELTVHLQCRGEISMQFGGLLMSMELNFSGSTA